MSPVSPRGTQQSAGQRLERLQTFGRERYFVAAGFQHLGVSRWVVNTLRKTEGKIPMLHTSIVPALLSVSFAVGPSVQHLRAILADRMVPASSR